MYSGAALTNNGDVYIGGGNSGMTNFGALIINGGTVINTTQFGVERGSGSTAQGRGELIVNGGFVQNTGSANNFSVGAYIYNPTNVAVATMTGGTIIQGTTANSGGIVYIDEGGSGTFNIQSGTLIVTNVNSRGIVFNNTPASTVCKLHIESEWWIGCHAGDLGPNERGLPKSCSEFQRQHGEV